MAWTAGGSNWAGVLYDAPLLGSVCCFSHGWTRVLNSPNLLQLYCHGEKAGWVQEDGEGLLPWRLRNVFLVKHIRFCLCVCRLSLEGHTETGDCGYFRMLLSMSWERSRLFTVQPIGTIRAFFKPCVYTTKKKHGKMNKTEDAQGLGPPLPLDGGPGGSKMQETGCPVSWLQRQRRRGDDKGPHGGQSHPTSELLQSRCVGARGRGGIVGLGAASGYPRNRDVSGTVTVSAWASGYTSLCLDSLICELGMLTMLSPRSAMRTGCDYKLKGPAHGWTYDMCSSQ